MFICTSCQLGSYIAHFPRMADARTAKLRRLDGFRRSKPHCSAAALHEILVDIKRHGAPEMHDRRDMRKARDIMMSDSDAMYGSILRQMECKLPDGNTVDIPVADPFASLSAAIKESNHFRRFLKECIESNPPSPEKPWNLILYCDEVTPGNPMAHLNLRKFQAFYWSLLEFGVSALSHEEAWFTLLTEFSTVVNTLAGGLSHLFGSSVKLFFKLNGFDFHKTGVLVTLDGGDYRIFAKLTIVIQDGGAHKAVWQSRGDAASKFCMLCKNLFTDESNMVAADGSRLLRCNIIKLDELEASTDTELRNNARFLETQSRTVRGEAFVKLQQAVGLTYAPNGVLLDRELDDILSPTSAFMHDYMHLLYVDGVMNLTVYLTFEKCTQCGFKGVYEAFSDYVYHWKWPGRLHGDHLGDIFISDRRDKHRNANHIKCQASDMLSLIGVLGNFTQTVLMSLDPAVTPACDALLALIHVAETISSSHRVTVSPAVLLGSVHRFLDCFTTAFGYEWLTPKAHWTLHLPETLQRFGRLLNCFALERKHRVPKRYATDMKNISKNASTSLLSEVVCHHLGSLAAYEFKFTVGLVGGHPAPTKTEKFILDTLELEDTDAAILVAQTARFSHLATCRRDDVVLVRDGGVSAGRVKLHFSVAGETLTILQQYTLRRRVGNLVVWDTSNVAHEVWETGNILAAVEYCVYPDSDVGIILPIEFR